MLKKTGALLTSAAIGLLSALPAVAEEHEGTFYLNPAMGLQHFDGDRSLERENFISLGLEYRYGAHWASEISVMDSDPDFKSGGSDLDLRQYNVDGIYYFSADKSVEPYVAVGLGHAEFDAGFNEDQETQGRFGLGARFLINDHWSAKADTKVLYGFDDDTVDTILMLGISYAFNGGKKSSPAPIVAAPMDSDGDGVVDANDQCQNTPAGVSVDVNGCALDTDGDGVADYKDQCPETPAGREVDENGCKYVLTTTEEVTLNVVFPSNSSVVPESYMSEIETVAEFMNKYSSVNAVIEGHTDDSGKAAYNEALSQRRADAVMKILVERFNISASRLTAKGYGEAQPIASNATAEGMQANRRVVAVMQAEVTE